MDEFISNEEDAKAGPIVGTSETSEEIQREIYRIKSILSIGTDTSDDSGINNGILERNDENYAPHSMIRKMPDMVKMILD